MAYWAMTCQIKDLLEACEDIDTVARGKQLADRVEEAYKRQCTGEIEDDLAGILLDLRSDCFSVDDFNMWLGKLYDWSDAGHRMWFT